MIYECNCNYNFFLIIIFIILIITTLLVLTITIIYCFPYILIPKQLFFFLIWYTMYCMATVYFSRNRFFTINCPMDNWFCKRCLNFVVFFISLDIITFTTGIAKLEKNEKHSFILFVEICISSHVKERMQESALEATKFWSIWTNRQRFEERNKDTNNCCFYSTIKLFINVCQNYLFTNIYFCLTLYFFLFNKWQVI